MFKRLVNGILLNQTIMLLVLGFALLASIFIDARNATVLPSDLRNRVIGSRMMEDGLSPYYYVWKEGSPVRYYDTYTLPTAPVSTATATPFFHWVMMPMANLLQFQLSTFWFCLTYLLLAICVLLIALATPPPRRTRLVLLGTLAVAFTYTVGWRLHLAVGQNYLFIPVLMAGCYYCFQQRDSKLHLFLFGAFASSLLLMRPIAFIFFLPFLFYQKNYLRWFVSAGAWLLVYGAFVLQSPVQQKNWQEYFSSVGVNVQLHQALLKVDPPPASYNGLPITAFEGIDYATKGNEVWATRLRQGKENSNFYILYEAVFKHKPSIALQTGLGIFCCLLQLAPLWWVKKSKLPAPVEMLLLLGFLLYNTYGFFSPINRGNYVFVEFLFPLLLLAASVRQFYIVPVVLLILGLYLNIAVMPFVVMEHNIGQFLLMLAMLWWVYRPLFVPPLKTENQTGSSRLLWI